MGRSFAMLDGAVFFSNERSASIGVSSSPWAAVVAEATRCAVEEAK